RNYLYGVSMRIGYNAPYNEDCEVRNNVIVNGGLDITKYKKAVKENNFILAKGKARPVGHLEVLRPNKYDPNRANVAVFNWSRTPEVVVQARGFRKRGEAYRLMDPRQVYGTPVAAGTCDGKQIRVPMRGEEFAALVLLRGN